mmetsp:Transcript_15672/g.17284  ORF Transcript_15672/g.17284 Transcript_15672/m.17284 type:complete len:567 (-) Transcript_15672:198-1898(-)
MTKRRNADEFSSEFERDKDSIRSQLLEGTIENYKRISSETIVDTKEKAEQSFMQYCELSSRIRNTIFTLYPKSDDGGEVVAMGTEDSNACGLLEDLEGPRLYEYEPTLVPKNKLCVVDEKTVQHVAAGGLHSAVIHRNGTVSTWGANDEYALGRGEVGEDDNHLIKPMITSELGEVMKDIIQIDAGDNHTIVLDIHGRAYVCGMYKDMDSGKWKDSKVSEDFEIKGNHKFPTEVEGFGGKVRMICAGSSWNAALSEDGFLYTWGMGNSGQLARSKSMGAKKIKATYIDSTGAPNNEYEDFDLTKSFMGKVFEEGKDTNGKSILRFKYFEQKIHRTFLTPQKVEWNGEHLVSKREVIHLACGDIHFLVVARDPGAFQTRVYSSGCSSFGQLGHGGTENLHELTPIEVLDDKNICKVAAGNSHSLALSMDGKGCYSWGKIDMGALGLYDETKTQKYSTVDFVGTPKKVAFPDTLGDNLLFDIIAGDTTSFALTNISTVYSWGYNENSQTGHYNDGEIPLIARPRLLDVIASVNNGIESSNRKPVAKNCRVTRIAAGGQHSLMVIKRYL